VTVRGVERGKGVAIVAEGGQIGPFAEGNVKAEQKIRPEFVSIIIGREENMTLGMSMNKSVEGFQCPD
jgi:hypothetical protein